MTRREEVLDVAKTLISGDRNKSYGEPLDNFKAIAGAMNALGYRGPKGRDFEPHDIAVFQVLVKLGRIMETPGKEDSWIDMAGYAGCGLEVYEKSKSFSIKTYPSILLEEGLTQHVYRDSSGAIYVLGINFPPSMRGLTPEEISTIRSSMAEYFQVSLSMNAARKDNSDGSFMYSWDVLP